MRIENVNERKKTAVDEQQLKETSSVTNVYTPTTSATAIGHVATSNSTMPSR